MGEDRERIERQTQSERETDRQTEREREKQTDRQRSNQRQGVLDKVLYNLLLLEGFTLTMGG